MKGISLRTTIHQPSYWPWLGLLDKIAKVDKYIILDDIAANKSSFQYRNQFYCSGKSKVLSLPVDYRLGKKINELKLKNSTWKYEHLNKLKNYYGKAPFFNEVYSIIEKVYTSYNDIYAFPFIFETMKISFSILGMNPEIIKSSEINSTLSKGDLVLELCVNSGTSVYLSGQGAKNYMTNEQLKQFTETNIELEWHQFEHPTYEQNCKSDFVPGLSCLDFFFWKGVEKGRKMFRENLKYMPSTKSIGN